MRTLRVWFQKRGPIRYISHLDLMRTMTRAIRRSGIPLWYTEGFNPHPYMTFALPLSLGMESLCESMDIRIEDDTSEETILSALQSAMPAGIEITAVKAPVLDPKFIAFAAFDVVFEDVREPDDFYAKANELLHRDSLIVQKLGKKGHKKVMKDVDLLEHLQSFSLKKDGEVLRMQLVLPPGSTTNVNPALLCDELLKLTDGALYRITRTALYTKDLELFA